MLKSILMGGAMLLAIPAFAQTTDTSSGTGTASSQTGTTTNDHEPMEAEDQATPATGTAGTGSQVNGGVTSSSPGAHSGHSGNQGTSTGTAGTGMSTGAADTGMSANAPATDAGMAAGTTAGAGGPFQAARSYPPCTRTRTDSCRQPGGR